MPITLGQAAKLAGVGKTTLTRAIKAGRLSATRNPDGSYSVDPAELSRVYSIAVATPATVAGDSDAVHHATPEARPRDSDRDPDTVARLAAMEAELKGLHALLDEVRQSRDDWRAQAERLALPAPVDPRPWWRRLTG